MDTFEVAVRVRPLNQKEISQNATPIIVVPNSKELVFDPASGNEQAGHSRHKNLTFNYDYVYDENTKNHDIFLSAVTPLLQKLLEGFNLTIFAYGTTSSGKTYTLSSPDGGIQESSLDFLFKSENPTKLKFSYFEIYNEEINDLLNHNNKNLKIIDQKGAIQVLNLTQLDNLDAEGIKQRLSNAAEARETFATQENEYSSRSHSILEVILPSNGEKLLIIDLAGSERIERTGATGQRLTEGCSINTSLLVLGNCLSALCRTSQYVPYRGSKLTRILEETLEGKSKVLMMCNVSPASVLYNDTLSSLTYAQRATYIKCQTKIQIQTIQPNTSELQEMVQQLREENEELVKELQAAKESGGREEEELQEEEVTQFVQSLQISKDLKLAQAKQELCEVLGLNDLQRKFGIEVAELATKQQGNKLPGGLLPQNNFKLYKIQQQIESEIYKEICELENKIIKLVVVQQPGGVESARSLFEESDTLNLIDLEKSAAKTRRMSLERWKRGEAVKIPGLGQKVSEYEKQLQELESELIQMDQTASMRGSRRQPGL